MKLDIFSEGNKQQILIVANSDTLTLANERLNQWIKAQRSKGYSDAQIRQVLVRQGFNNAEVDSALSKNNQQLRFSPKAIGGINFLLYGSGYLFLHRYLRFFAMLIILVISGILLGIIGVMISYILVVIDTTRLAKRIQKGDEKLGPGNVVLAALILIFAGIIISFTLFPKYLFAFSESSCNIYYPAELSLDPFSFDDAIAQNNNCKNKVIKGETLFTFYKEKIPIDKVCESEIETLREQCYFKKAIDAKNYKYCYNTKFSDTCMQDLAIYFKDEAICQYATKYIAIACGWQIKSCVSGENQSCELSGIFTCDLFYDDEQKECLRKYGSNSP